jgi:MoaA/NifB/PqqE/SkfB family radical SAM enzyme
MTADVPGWPRLKRRALELAQPLATHLELTYACNWRCVFCYNPRHHDRKRMDAEEWSLVLDDLRSLGTLNITVTGGEPLAHPEALEILAAIRARAMVFRLFTNGALVTDAIARQLAELRPISVELSLHGATAQTHERATTAPGSFAAMWAGIGHLRDHGLPVVLKTPLTRLNEAELLDMVALTEREGLHYTVDPTLTHKDDGDAAPLAFSVSAEGLDRLYGLLAEKGRLPASGRVANGLNCGLGRTTLAVDPEGNVYPCPQWRSSSLGNVRETPLRELWHPSPVRMEAADVARAANESILAGGGPMARFPFCPALALERTGDPLRADAIHLAQADAVDRARRAAP